MVRMDDAPGGTAAYAVLAANSPTRVIGVWQDTREPSNNFKIYAALGEESATAIDDGAIADPSGRGRIVAWPNPTVAGAQVRLSLVGESAAREVALYDPAGRLVRKLALSGDSIVWDSRDACGAPVASGAYWARALGAQEAAARFVVLR